MDTAYATFSATGQYYAEDREKLKDELRQK